MMARFRNFYNIKKSEDLGSFKRRSAFRTGAKIHLSKKNILGLWALLVANQKGRKAIDNLSIILNRINLALFMASLRCVP